MKTFKHFNSLKIIASLLLVATPLSADDLISEPTEFYNGEIADAADINSNFKIVFDSVRALQGATDTKILVGEVEPAAELGNVGDIYFDTVNLLLWGPKVEEGWVTSVSIEGAPGGRGPKGDPGSDGMDGSDGADGEDGDSCTIEQENGGAFITCGSGTSAAIYDGTNGADGANGADGEDGTSCSVTQETTGAKISCTDGSNASLQNGINGTNGTNGINGTNGTDGEDGEDGQDGRSCTSTQGDGVVTISCDDGTSGQVASGRCSATQSGSNVVIDCADGSGGILASEGTVVTFLDGQRGEIDYTFNTGMTVVKDGQGRTLGRFGSDRYDGEGDEMYIVLEEETPKVVITMRSYNSEVQYTNNINGKLYFDQANCLGAPFVNNDVYRSRVMVAFGSQSDFYIDTGEVFYSKVVNSRWGSGGCEEFNQMLNAAYLIQAYIPTEEVRTAQYPLTLEQLP